MINFVLKYQEKYPVGIFWFVGLLWILPSLALMILGFLFLWQKGWFLWFWLGLFILTLFTFVIRSLLVGTKNKETDLVQHLEPMPNWSSHDTDVWQTSLENIQKLQLVMTPWEELPKAMYAQLAFVARSYGGNGPYAEYAFTLPELLLMLETWSREYRAFIIENVPFSQNIKLSTLRNMSGKTKTAYHIYKVGSPVVTLARIAFSPVTGIAREITSYLVSKQMSGFSEHVQKNMKQMLFEQVTQVAIDLYGGRLQLSEQELLAYRRSLKKPEEPEVRPLSVMIIGQVNAGKSSLVNALKQQCVAEIDVLPATKGFSFHHLKLSNGSEISLIDTPGLDGSKNTSDSLIKKAVTADLLLWVSQVNQPAKALDKQLLGKWNDYFSSHKERKKPPILLVTTHNDMLPRSGKWNPPYDLSDATNKRVVSMMEALRFSHQTIGLPKESLAVPVALAPGQTPYNLDVLRDLLVSVSHEARAAQLNKERLEATDSASIVAKGLQQCVGLVKIGVNLILK